ncbi:MULTISPECIES: hypothetical protein [Nocardia]|uniref:hypothetical protein n=1 Tax=Nocardia TaxID=1817 RepID=UPI0007A49899|nr:hypothetical protein [Nocardia africana]
MTLRDGGFEVDFHWPADHFTLVPATSHAAGVEIVELGYLGGVPLDHSVARAGVGAYVTPAQVAAAAHDEHGLAAMVHPTALADPLDLEPYAMAGLDMVRLVYHPSWTADIAAVATQAHQLDLTVAINIAMASRYSTREIAQHAARITDTAGPDLLYLADTCSSLRPGQVTELVTSVRDAVGPHFEIGFHAHDFLNLAYANALAAVEAGATWIDCSLLGLGRGGGNLAAEPLLLAHRLPAADPAAAELLLKCRAALAATTGQLAPSLVPAVCAALNLTPVEEQALRTFAAHEHLRPDQAALWLLTHTRGLPTLRTADLHTHWHDTMAVA